MVKYLALAAVVVGSLAVADIAEARGRRGCSTCYNGGGGCPGGVCAVPYAPGPAPVAPIKAAVVTPATPEVAATPVVAPAAPRYYTSNVRRGLFGWRR
jgi:hypothetical protein